MLLLLAVRTKGLLPEVQNSFHSKVKTLKCSVENNIFCIGVRYNAELEVSNQLPTVGYRPVSSHSELVSVNVCRWGLRVLVIGAIILLLIHDKLDCQAL